MHLDGGAARGFANGVEDGREFLSLPQHHAGGDDDFGIPHVLAIRDARAGGG